MYLFYNYAGMALDGEKGGLGRRAVCAEYMFHDHDGSIRPVVQTAAGIGVPRRPEPEAESRNRERRS